MFLAMMHDPTALSLGHRGVVSRAIGLAVLALGAYLALTIPPRLRRSRGARQAQLAVALYAVLTTAVAGAVAAASVLRPHGWFVDDRLADASSLTFLSLVVLAAGLLAAAAARGLTSGRFNATGVLVFPYFVVGGFQSLMLGYFWFGPAVRAPGAEPNSPTGLAFSAAAAAIGAAVVAISVRRLLREQELRGAASGAGAIAGLGAVAMAAMIVLRAEPSGYTAHGLYGVDLMIGGALAGALVFAITFLGTRSTVTVRALEPRQSYAESRAA